MPRRTAREARHARAEPSRTQHHRRGTRPATGPGAAEPDMPELQARAEDSRPAEVVVIVVVQLAVECPPDRRPLRARGQGAGLQEPRRVQTA